MSSHEDGVAGHYAAPELLEIVRGALTSMGIDPDDAPPEALRPVDEFHIGGAEATDYLLDKLGITSETRVLDIGSGLGGAARVIAARFGCPVTGIDLTPDFVEAARGLNRMCGMDMNPSFEVGSATDMPVVDDAFDLATMLHVGMNIPDKPGIFNEAHRVVRNGGIFAIYDVMRTGQGDLTFPVPWAAHAGLSALAEPDVYRRAAASAGFTLEKEENRQAIALEFFARVRAKVEEMGGPPALGLHNIMGATTGAKVANMVAGIKGDVIAPVLMIFRNAKEG